MNRMRGDLRKRAGFSLIEVLVTMVIMLIGLLGLAGTMMQSHRSETESYQRVQALLLLEDMVARINANRKVASCYALTTDTAGGAPFLGTDYSSTPTCAAGTSAQQELAVRDLEEWSELLIGASEVVSQTSKVGGMIGARGCVSFDAATGVYQISVAWQGIGATAEPPAGWTCGTGNYGDEKWRRVVSVTMRIADLG